MSDPSKSGSGWPLEKHKPFVEMNIEGFLSHPHRLARMLPFVLESVAPSQRLSTIDGWMEQMNQSVWQGPQDLDLFAKELVNLGAPQFGMEERSRARVIYSALQQWMILERARRDRRDHPNPSPDWSVPDDILALMIELDTIGADLRGRWSEASAVHKEMQQADIRSSEKGREGNGGETKRPRGRGEAKAQPAVDLKLRSALALLNDSQREVLRELLKAVTKGDGLTLDELTTNTKANNRSTVDRAIGELEKMGFPIPNMRNGAGYSLKGRSLKAAQELARMDAETTPKRR